MNDQTALAEPAHLTDVPLNISLEDDQSLNSTPSKTDQSTATVTSQPKSGGSATGSGSNKGYARVTPLMPFDEAHSERDWASPLWSCKSKRGSCCWMCCCWPYYRYDVSVRLGETPFMPLIPCAALALRVKMRALFSIKGSLLKDFFTALCCEPCVVCQMTRELDHVGL